jgi:HAD superfamily hydrolase (TIGR01549 family)
MSETLETLCSRAQEKRLIVFDMDNTLMDEARYLFAGYEAVAKFAAADDAKLARAMAACLKDQFALTGRERLFDTVRERYPQARGTLAEWLELLRCAVVDLPMLEWVEPFCAELPEIPLAILTNGNAPQQRNKYRQLRPAALRDRMRLYCAADTQPKPSPAGLWRILGDYKREPHEALMIGDSDSDAACAAAAGVDFAWAPLL